MHGHAASHATVQRCPDFTFIALTLSSYDHQDMTNSDGDREVGYQGRYQPWIDPPDWQDGAPTSGRNQSCAFCGDPSVRWVHPMAQDRVQYRVYGKGHTLPHFWMLCDRCEGVYASGDDDAAIELMLTSNSWSLNAEHVDEAIRQPLTVFRHADRGARRLVD